MPRHIFAIIAAAGRGRRMGRLKQLMPYRDGTMMDAVIDAVMETPVEGLVLVTNELIVGRFVENPDEDLLIAVNSDPRSEMIDSVRIGLRRLREAFNPRATDGVMILPGDQPEIRSGVLTTCAEDFRRPRNAPGILIATYRGRRAHPAIFRMNVIEEIESWESGHGLNELAKLHPELVRQSPIHSGPMPIDVNTPEDYERLRGR
ncbi:MAG: nucleotidyltransferase family protein [Phycisphaerae bacterium]|nr:nucleotidyltransferase family protein [Phycisphaerae bacterium]